MGSFKSPPAGAVTNRALDAQRALGITVERPQAAPTTPVEAVAADFPKRSADSISTYHPKVVSDAEFIRDYIHRDVGHPQYAERVTSLLLSYEDWDTTIAASNPEHGHGNLDAIFIALARLPSFDDGFIFSHHRLPTDILWFDLPEPFREQYRRLYTLSALGAHRRPDEGTNYGKEMAKQEAIGVLGILKGVAVGAAGLVDDLRFVLPGTGKDNALASEKMSSTFDDAATWWVGKDWTQGEAVLLGLSAAELGELGGSLAFTLATLEVKALKIVQSILMFPAMARSLDGALDRLGKVYLEDRDAARSASADPRIWQEIVGIAGSLLGLLLSKTASGQRIGTKLAHFLLDAAPIGPIIGKIIEAALSDDPPETKRRAIGLALGELLQMAAAIAGGRIKDHKLGGSKDEPPPDPRSRFGPPNSMIGEDVETPGVSKAPDAERAELFGPKNSKLGADDESAPEMSKATDADRDELFSRGDSMLGDPTPDEAGPAPFSKWEKPFDAPNAVIGPDRLPNEPPLKRDADGKIMRPAPANDAERKLAWQMLGNESGEGDASFDPSKPGRTWKTAPPKAFGPDGTAEFTEPIEFNTTKPELVTVRVSENDPQGKVVRIEVPEAEKLAKRARDPETQAERDPYRDTNSPGETLHRALKGSGIGGHNFSDKAGHIVPDAIGGARLPYNLEPMTKAYNNSRRVKAEALLKTFLQTDQREDLTLVIERDFGDGKNRVQKERFVVYAPEGSEGKKVVFDVTVKAQGTPLVIPDGILIEGSPTQVAAKAALAKQAPKGKKPPKPHKTPKLPG